MFKPLKPSARPFFYFLLVGSLLSAANGSLAQCTITNLNASYCLSDAPVALVSSPGGLNFYQSGVAGTIASYNPALNGAGIDTVVTTSGIAASYTVSTSGTFNRIIRSGTVINPGEDGEVTGINIPFTFNFFSTDYTQLKIGRNGLVGFGASSVAVMNNLPMPNAAVPDNIIAAAWDDLTIGGVIKYFTVGRAPFRKFVIDYNAVPRQVGLYPITTQIQLHETTNVIEIHTTTTQFATYGNSASQGIENSTGTIGSTVTGRNDLPWDATNDYVAFIPNCLQINFVTVTAPPTVAVVGMDIENCNNGTFSLIGNAPGAGTGLWSVPVGSATVVNPTSPSATVINVTAGASATLRWTISNGACTPSSDDVILTNYSPSTSSAGSDITQCNNSNFTLGGNTPLTGTGLWSLIAGTASITTPGSPTSTITGLPVGTSATLRWTITNGVCTSVDDVIITNNATPSTSSAGSDISQCNNSNFTLAGNAPTIGTGLWSLISGTATITTPGSLASTVTGVPVGTSATLRWTISNGTCTTSTDDITLTNSASPSTADAGLANIDQCNTSIFLMNATAPVTGTGAWSLVTGTAIITEGASRITTITGIIAGTSATLRWTVSSGLCAASTDDIILKNDATPTTSSVGSDIEQCNNSNFTLGGTLPTIGMGLWTVIGAANGASITTPGLETSTVTGLTPGFSVTLRWTISNGTCTPSTDDVILTNNALPTVASAGSDMDQCNNGTFVLTGNAPAIGAGTWSLSSGTATITNPSLESTTVTGIAPGTSATLRWTIGNGVCTPSSDDVVLTNYIQIPIANAGSDVEKCNIGNFTLAANSAAPGSGVWTIIGPGNGAIIATPSSATSAVTGLAIGSSVTLRWTISNGVCASNSDDVILRVNQNAIVVAPADFTVCETNRINLSGLIGGSAISGSWTVISGGGTLSVSSVTGTNVTATYDIHASDIGATMKFRLATNDPDGAGPCIAEVDDMDIIMNQSPKVDAAENAPNTIEVCEDMLVNLDGVFSGTASAIIWSGGSGAAQFANVNDPNTTYTITPADVTAGSIYLTLTTNDPDGSGPNGPCLAESSIVTIVINKLPGVFLSGLAPSYAENDPPVSMDGFPWGGMFTGPGVVAGTNIFNPDNANIGFNTLGYTYTDPKGCTNFSNKIVVVNELTSVEFGVFTGTGFDFSPIPEICANIGKAYLKGSPDVGAGQNPTFFSSPTTPSIIGFDINGYYIDTDGLLSGNYFVKYTYTNSSFATSELIKQIVIYAAPNAVIGATNSCVEDAIMFNDLSTIPNNILGGNVISWLWNFDDQGLSSTLVNPTYKYDAPNVYNVKLTVTTNQGCWHEVVKQISVGPVPKVDFEWTKICSGENTVFTDISAISGGFSAIKKYQWDFGDGVTTQLDLANQPIPSSLDAGRTTGTYGNPNHLFKTFSEYSVRLTVETDVGCISYVDKRVYILDYPIPTPTVGYFEDFENGPGTWVKTALAGTSWVFGNPNGKTIAQANSGKNAWWTGGNIDTLVDRSTYFNNENSEVIGPCLDLRGLKRPMVSLNFRTDTQHDFDGVVLQYSTDGGRIWRTIGDNSGAGINWYNSSNLRGNPGGQDNFAWSNSSGGWKNARFNLDQIPRSLLGQVVFRIAFGSNDDNPAGKVLDGFAFDNIYIGEKQRNVLVEHFTNLLSGPSNNANDDMDDLYAMQSATKVQPDFFKIEYHVSNPGPDSLNLYNPTAPAARGLFYGVSQPPASLMDGILGNYFYTYFNGSSARITNDEVDRRSLEDPKFEIKLDTLPGVKNQIKARLRIKYIDSVQAFSSPVIVQLALVETDLRVGTSARLFKNVLRKFLLENEGLTISIPWTYGLTRQVDVDQIIDVPIRNKSKLYLVAFVQDKVTKHIHQTYIVKGPLKIGLNPVGLEDDPVAAEVRGITVYPNPAANTLNFKLDNTLTRSYNWKVIDQRGVTVLDGELQENFQEVNISSLSNGIYFVIIGADEKSLVYRKIVVMN